MSNNPIEFTFNKTQGLFLQRNSSVAIVFFHGYGANMYDLLGLGNALDRKEANDWYFPNGLYPVHPLYPDSRKWFDIDEEKLQESMSLNQHRDLSDYCPENFGYCLSEMSVFVKSLREKYSKVIIGGFSQGAILSYHLATHIELSVDGLILFSGNIMNKKAHQRQEPLNSIHYFQSHGKHDPILGIKGAQTLFNLLKSWGWKGEWVEFEGGHEIPNLVLNQCQKYLDGLTA